MSDRLHSALRTRYFYVIREYWSAWCEWWQDQPSKDLRGQRTISANTKYPFIVLRVIMYTSRCLVHYDGKDSSFAPILLICQANIGLIWSSQLFFVIPSCINSSILTESRGGNRNEESEDRNNARSIGSRHCWPIWIFMGQLWLNIHRQPICASAWVVEFVEVWVEENVPMNDSHHDDQLNTRI